jgi:dihydroflavonol-4-reductase
MREALVTGGCGFLGGAVVKQLVERGVNVRVLALPGESTANVDGLDVEVMRGNVLDIEDARRSLEGMDTLFHLAAVYKAWMPDPTPMYDVAMRGTFNMLEAARRTGVERVIFTASIVALGRPPIGSIGDENTTYDAWDLDFAYSRSKYHSRVLAQDFVNWGLDVRIVCPGVVLGPGDITPTPSGKLIVDCVRGIPPFYTEGGASYVDVRDAAEVHVLAEERGKPGEIYLATAHNLTMYELIQTVHRVQGVSRRYYRMPVGLMRPLVMAAEKAARRKGEEPPLSRNFFEYSLKPSFFSNDKTVNELGASFRPIEETVRDAIAYFRERGMLPAA